MFVLILILNPDIYWKLILGYVDFCLTLSRWHKTSIILLWLTLDDFICQGRDPALKELSPGLLTLSRRHKASVMLLWLTPDSGVVRNLEVVGQEKF